MAVEPVGAGLENVRAVDAVELHYSARASLLAELSRQTYDAFYKALREAVLNGIDADAAEVRIDLAPDCGAELVVEDDGHGMDTTDLAERFLAVGGSSKYGDSNAFGRIGIGSLALLAYAEITEIQSKKAGETTLVRAVLRTPSASTNSERNDHLAAFSAGSAHVEVYDGDRGDHFTRLRLLALRPEAREVVQNPTATYALIERLRRILPLPSAEGRVYATLANTAPDLAEVLRQHTAVWSRSVFIRSRYDGWRPLTRRTFGDDAGGELWSGELEPIHHRLRVRGRDVLIAGFMAAQKRANPRWSGLTARVQNVAVAEETFFGMTNDPGFRKYITGEVFLLGDLDQDRLVNINRTSFNAESDDYIAVARFMTDAIDRFKKRSVARDQRAKVQVRRLLEERRALVDTTTAALRAVGEMQLRYGVSSLPSSNLAALRGHDADLASDLRNLAVKLIQEPAGNLSYRIELPEQGAAIVAHVDEALLSPVVDVAGKRFRLRFVADQREVAPRVRFKARPREVSVNLAHCCDAKGKVSYPRVSMAVTLEAAVLLAEACDLDLYDVLHDISGSI